MNEEEKVRKQRKKTVAVGFIFFATIFLILSGAMMYHLGAKKACENAGGLFVRIDECYRITEEVCPCPDGKYFKISDFEKQYPPAFDNNS